MSDLLDTLIGTALMGGAYYLGATEGKRIGYNEGINRSKDDEIMELRREIERLKRMQNK